MTKQHLRFQNDNQYSKQAKLVYLWSLDCMEKITET